MTALNTGMTTLTHNDWRAAGQDLFGSDLMSWRFACPACGDVANGHDFAAALSENPRTRLDGSVVQALDLLGRKARVVVCRSRHRRHGADARMRLDRLRSVSGAGASDPA